MRLLLDGNYVIGIDNLFTGSVENLKKLKTFNNFEFIRHDITLPIYLECDEIYNLACPASPKWYQKDPIQTMKVSVVGAINMLGIARRTGAKILQASTSEIYGDPEVSPQTESYCGKVDTLSIRSCYDEGKRAVETLFMDYYRKNGVDTKIARIFNTYGPNMQIDDGRVISNFICQALKNEPITIYGTGEQTRSFQYVDDLIEGLINLMQSNYHYPVNLGNPEEFTIFELAKKIKQIVPESSSELIWQALPQDDPKQRCPDISRAKELFGYNPKIKLDEGLEKTISYFKKEV